MGASIIAAVLLALVYGGLCIVASQHAVSIPPGTPPEELLSTLAIQLLGPRGAFVGCIAVALACFTTAISLASISAAYIREDILRNKINVPMSLVVCMAIAILTTTLGFTGILRALAPVLEVGYPGLIVICGWNIGSKLIHLRRQRLALGESS